MLLAANLRPALTGVAPLIGEIRADTGISNGMAGLLTTLPLLAFALLSPVAPRVARRFGMERVLLASLLVLVAGILLRWAEAVAALFLGTAILGAAIAVGNVLLPGLVKREFPERAGLMTSVYSTSLGHQRRARRRRERPPGTAGRHRLARSPGGVGRARLPRRRRLAPPARP